MSSFLIADLHKLVRQLKLLLPLYRARASLPGDRHRLRKQDVILEDVGEGGIPVGTFEWGGCELESTTWFLRTFRR